MPATTDLTFVRQAEGGYAVQLGDVVIGYALRSPHNPAVWNACVDINRRYVVAQRSTLQRAGAALALRLRAVRP